MRLASLLTIITVVSACGKDDSKDSNELNLAGTWRSGCVTEGESGTQHQASFDAASLDYLVTSFRTSTCADADKSTSLRLIGTYRTGGNAQGKSENVNATSLDITLTAIKMAIHDQAKIDEFGTGGICGVSPVKDVEFDVSKSTCPANLGVNMDVGSVLYQIFRASGTELFFGYQTESLDGSSAEKRPVTLRTSPMVRQ